jgi:hypothetical protein
MPEPIDLVSTVRYLFAPSTLPLVPLLLKSNLDGLTSLLSLQNVQTTADVNQYQLLAGPGALDGIAVLQLIIDANSITLNVGGTRGDLDRVLEALRGFLVRIDPKGRLEKPRIHAITYLTQSTVQLSVPFERLLSRELSDFVHNQEPVIQQLSPGAKVSIQLSNLAFQVRFEMGTTDFVYAPKPLTIEPRAGSRAKDRLYFIQTPTDSVEHMRMVASLEKALDAKLLPKSATRRGLKPIH